ncbi:NUDIX hydrolase [Chitinophaga caseinilytica]|uniref:NUDIX domain-containing protein n=1 Tax=Chitinophaga caseinilytica TaxID=2267521 RepID=A0ABZ2Z2H5_9BACT
MSDFHSYQNPALTTDLVVFGYQGKTLSVLLLNRKSEPFKNGWTLPGAFVGLQETFSEACRRILASKLGLPSIYLEQLYTFDGPQRDPRGRVVSVAYFALVSQGKLNAVAGQMANDVRWFPVNEIPELGFDHRLIFDTALERLRAKIRYQPVGFELLDEKFTMPELQDLYESILGFPIDRRNFRRKLLDVGFVQPTGDKTEGLQHRPADYYTFNKQLHPQHFHLNL